MSFVSDILKLSVQRSPIVVGIDPNFFLMPDWLQPKSNIAKDIKQSLIDFSRIVIESVSTDVCAIKPQAAYFEQFGTPGMEALSETLSIARKHGLKIIMDVKRGDIGSTSTAYAQGYLASEVKLPDGTSFISDLESDAMTINPFMGEDAINPFVEIAQKYQKGLFILVHTSNPGAGMIMQQKISNQSISHRLASHVQSLGSSQIGVEGYHNIGAVVGATVTEVAKDLRSLMPNSLILIPGMGTQGGDLDTVLSLFNDDGNGGLIPISRGITYLKDKTVDQNQYRQGIKDNARHFKRLIQQGLESR